MRLPSLLLCFAAALASVSAGSPEQKQTETQPILFAGTVTRDEGWVNGTGLGIYTYKLDMKDGSLTPFNVTPVGVNPIYVQGSKKVFSTGKRVIYAINSVNEESRVNPGVLTGYVSALTLKEDGTLELLNTLETHGGSAMHISLSPDDDFLVVSNYDDSMVMFSLNGDGSLGEETFYQTYPNGSNVVENRQTAGHLHSTMWLPNSKHVIAANLGSDELLQYELDEVNKTLKSLDPVMRPPGSGPRHMALHPEGEFAYVVDELSNTVGVYKIDKQAALLSSTSLQTITTLPTNFTNGSWSADIHLSSNGKFLYSSNRGHDSIAMFKIDEKDGTLTALGWESSRGITPRGFTVYGDWLIVANQDSNNMHVFHVNDTTGLLSYTGNSYETGTAVCLYVAEYDFTGPKSCQ